MWRYRTFNVRNAQIIPRTLSKLLDIHRTGFVYVKLFKFSEDEYVKIKVSEHFTRKAITIAREAADMERLVIKHFEDRIKKQEYIGKRDMKTLPENLRGRILEIGCGARLTYAPRSNEVCGIDISLEMARHFTMNHPLAQIVVADARSLPFQKDSFDIVVMNSVLHHLVGITPQQSLNNATNALKDVKRILRHTGTLLIIELVSRNFIFSLIMFYTTLLCAKLGIDVDFLDIHSAVVTFFFTDKALKHMSSTAGLTIKDSESVCWRFLKINLGHQVTYSLKPENI